MASSTPALFRTPKSFDMALFPQGSPFATWPAHSIDMAAISALHPHNPNAADRASLLPHVVLAIRDIVDARKGRPPTFLTLVKVSAGVFASETDIADSSGNITGEHLLVTANQNGELRAAIVDTGNHFRPLPALTDKAIDDLPLKGLYAPILMVLASKVPEADDALAALTATDMSQDGWTKPYNRVYHLCDCIYYALKSNVITFATPGNNIQLLPDVSVRAGSYAGEVIAGSAPDVLFGSAAGTTAANGKTVLFKAAKAEFSAWRDKMSWTPEDERFIPSFPDDYPVPPEALKIARRYVWSTNKTRPMRNFFWRGITSYGKSTGVELMAAMLGMPLLRVTCSSTMETQQFLSDFVPDNTPSVKGELPSFMEMECDPETAYLTLTGVEKADATSQECLEAYGAAIAAQAQGGNTARFKHVESNFIKALRKGYICEVQEISRIKDPGVLVGLNEYDRPGSVIPLIDGTYATRHPDAMVVYTDNIGYASCRAIDPSVIRRMAFIIDSNELPRETAIDRVVYNTGFSDLTLLDNMYDLWRDIAEYCREHEMTEGSVSVTELEMWASTVMADNMSNLRENCVECVVAKATSDPAEQQDIISAVLNTSSLTS